MMMIDSMLRTATTSLSQSLPCSFAEAERDKTWQAAMREETERVE
jgi:hypothetical protein